MMYSGPNRRREQRPLIRSCGFTDVVKNGPDYRCTVCNKIMPPSWLAWVSTEPTLKKQLETKQVH